MWDSTVRLSWGSSAPSHLQGHTHALLPSEHKVTCTHLARSVPRAPWCPFGKLRAHSTLYSREAWPETAGERPCPQGCGFHSNFFLTFFSPSFFLFSKHLSQPFLPFLKGAPLQAPARVCFS